VSVPQPELEDGETRPRSRMTPGGRAVRILLGVILLWVIGYLLLPSGGHPRWISEGMQSSNDLKQIGIALENYHDTHGTFPPAYIADEEGRPMHSWRVLILPYWGHADLHSQYDFDKPWDDPENLKLAAQIPDLYASPPFREHRPEGLTTYLAISAEGTVLGTTEAIRPEDITEPTVMVIEAKGNPVPWIKPEDISPDQVNVDPERIISLSKEGIHLLMSDGSVRFVENNPPRKDVRRGFYVDVDTKIDEDR